MKTILKGLFLLPVLVFSAGCGSGGDDAPRRDPLADGWVLASWNGSEELAGKVYLQFDAADGFVLYQSIDTPGFTAYSGTCSFTGDLLTGRYSDGTAWADAYTVLTRTDDALVLRARSDDILSVYRKVQIPAYVKRATSVRVRASGRRFL